MGKMTQIIGKNIPALVLKPGMAGIAGMYFSPAPIPALRPPEGAAYWFEEATGTLLTSMRGGPYKPGATLRCDGGWIWRRIMKREDESSNKKKERKKRVSDPNRVGEMCIGAEKKEVGWKLGR